MTMQHASKKSMAAAGRRRAMAVAIGAIVAAAGPAQAFEIETGNPDWSVRWDNTFRYNLGWRVESRDQAIGNSIIADEGTYSFDKGDIVQNRLDLLTELDVVYKRMMGFRVSAAGVVRQRLRRPPSARQSGAGGAQPSGKRSVSAAAPGAAQRRPVHKLRRRQLLALHRALLRRPVGRNP